MEAAAAEAPRLRRPHQAARRSRRARSPTPTGYAGISARVTAATAMVVSPTAKTTSPMTGDQLSRRSRGEASKAASSRTGATNSASASSGRTVNDGAPGTNASDGAAEREKDGIRCADAPRASREHGGGENEANQDFEFFHRPGNPSRRRRREPGGSNRRLLPGTRLCPCRRDRSASRPARAAAAGWQSAAGALRRNQTLPVRSAGPQDGAVWNRT